MEWGNRQLPHSVTPCEAVAPHYVASRYQYVFWKKIITPCDFQMLAGLDLLSLGTFMARN